MTTAVVFAGGDPPPAGVGDDLPDERWVVAADGGADHALAAGIDVDLIVGDLDSIDPRTLESTAATVQRHPVDKDATDLELALAAVARRPEVTRVLVVGGNGGRLDHLLANAAVMCSDRWLDLDIEWLAGPARVTIVRDHARIHGHPGETVSLIPLGGMAAGVRTTGLRWALDGEDMIFGSSRGVSNEFASAVATVSLRRGVVLAVQPTGC
jgi:thiamine pyrophosphokinase